MFIKVYDIKNEVIDYDSFGSLARTLDPDFLGTHHEWTVKGLVMEDYFEWVNYFEATHPKFGFVAGNYESEIISSSKEAYLDFCKYFPFAEWDYWDI